MTKIKHTPLLYYSILGIFIFCFVSCTFEAELDKQYYPAEEVKNIELLMQENGVIKSTDNAFFSSEYVDSDDINPYRYFIKKGHGYSGKVELETIEMNNTWNAKGELEDGLKVREWTFSSKDGLYEIKGDFKYASMTSTICCKEWYVKNKKDSITQYYRFNEKNEATIKLVNKSKNSTITYFAQTGGRRTNKPMNPSPLSNSYLYLAKNIRFDWGRHDWVYSIDSLTETIKYQDHNLKTTINEGKLSNLKYYDDSLRTIVVHFSKRQRIDSLECVYNDNLVDKTFYAEKGNSKNLIRYNDKGEKIKLAKSAFNLPRIDSLRDRLLKFNPFVKIMILAPSE